MKTSVATLLATLHLAAACVHITGNCQIGTIQPFISINLNDNNGQAICAVNTEKSGGYYLPHQDMSCNVGGYSAWVEDCERVHYSTPHGDFNIKLDLHSTTTCNRPCVVGGSTVCCDFEQHRAIDTKALC